MNTQRRAYAIIPARAGSKRIPGKNTRTFHGKPLLAWPIGTLKESGLFDEIIVSTESDEIAGIAALAGAEAPFRRPEHLADDFTTTAAVARHAIDWFLGHGASPSSLFCVMYPAAVNITPADLEASKRVLQGDIDMVFAATDFPSPIERAWSLENGGVAKRLFPEHGSTRTQDLSPKVYDAGQFYWTHSTAWHALDDGSPLSYAAFKIPFLRAVDIDTPEDWKIAERLFRLDSA